MRGVFKLHCERPTSGKPIPENLPRGTVRLVGEPRVGECLVLVSTDADGVVQTSRVRSVTPTIFGIEIETVNSRYTLVHATDGALTGVAA